MAVNGVVYLNDQLGFTTAGSGQFIPLNDLADVTDCNVEGCGDSWVVMLKSGRTVLVSTSVKDYLSGYLQGKRGNLHGKGK